MPQVTSATHRTYARWVVEGQTHAVATDDDVRDGVPHAALLVADAELGERWVEEVATASNLLLTVADNRTESVVLLDEFDDPLLDEQGDPLLTESPAYASLAVSPVEGLQVTVEVVTRVEFDVGPPFEHVRVRTLTCTGREFAPGVVRLQLSDIEDQRLNTLFPPRTFRTDDWPVLEETDAGRPVARIFGTALKIQAARVTSSAPWRYVLLDTSDAASPSVLTVYRGSSLAEQRVVDPSEYTVGSALTPWPHLYLEFAREQRGFNGAPLIITADVQDYGADAPVAAVMDALAQVAGITLDPAGFTALDTWCTDQGRVVSCDFGRGGQQRTCRAILEDLLAIASATVQRTPAGDYTFVVDEGAKSVTAYDEDAGDAIEVIGLREPARPASVTVNYRPGPRDVDRLQMSQTRLVPGGSLGAERARALRYIRSGFVADRVAWYRAVRALHSQRLRLRIYRATHALGDVLEISSRTWGVYGSRWRVREAQTIVGGVELECTPYVPELFTYLPAELSPDAVADYTPDYSATPPAAPVFSRVIGTETVVAADGTLTALVRMRAGPPPGNWAELMVALVHDITGEISLQVLTTDLDGGQSAVVTGLRPGEPYKMLVYARNSYGLQGAVRDTFDAVAIGGGEADTVLTTAGFASTPPSVATITAAQIPPRAIDVKWTAVTAANLREYVLERSVNSLAWTEVWRGRTLSYVDRDVGYGATYQYRIRARDTWGNFSGYTESTLVAISTGQVFGGSSGNDIAISTVSTSNRTAVSTISGTTGSVGFFGSTAYTIAHGLGRVPVIGQVLGINTTLPQPTGAAVDASADSSNITFYVYGIPRATSSVNAANPHTHDLVFPSGTYVVAADVW